MQDYRNIYGRSEKGVSEEGQRDRNQTSMAQAQGRCRGRFPSLSGPNGQSTGLFSV
jgi:hypothetical protein